MKALSTPDNAAGLSPVSHRSKPRRTIDPSWALVLLACVVAMIAALAAPAPCDRGSGPQAWPDLQVMQVQAMAGCAKGEEAP